MKNCGQDNPGQETRNNYRYILAVPTRWMDNDVYQHVNNVIYYSYFDTVVNEYLIREGILDYENSEIIGLVVETCCRYHKPLKFPDIIDAAVRIPHIGSSSVRYEIALFCQGQKSPSATGYFVHVYVNRAGRKPVYLSGKMRSALQKIAV